MIVAVGITGGPASWIVGIAQAQRPHHRQPGAGRGRRGGAYVGHELLVQERVAVRTSPSASHTPPARSRRRPPRRTVNEKGRRSTATRSRPRSSTTCSEPRDIVVGTTEKLLGLTASSFVVHKKVTGVAP